MGLPVRWLLTFTTLVAVLMMLGSSWNLHGADSPSGSRELPGAADCPQMPPIPKVALMFLTRGPLPHQAMWVEWLAIMDGLIPADLLHEGLCAADMAACLPSWQQQLEERRGLGSEPGERQLLFSVYVHPSKEYKQPYIEHVFNQAIIRKRVVTKWGSHTLVDAAKALVRTALRDPLNQVFVLLDESTIPLYPPTAVWQQLLDERVSRINPCYDPKVVENTMLRWTPEMDPPIPAWLWRKSQQWFTLTRLHAQLIDSDVELDALMEQHCTRGWDEALNRARGCYSDEHYFATLLAYYGMDKETSCASNSVHVDWRDGTAHPRSYQPDEVTASRLRRIREGTKRTCNGEVVIRQSLAMFVATANMSTYSCKRPRPAYNSKLIAQPGCHLFARKFEAPTVVPVMDLFFDCEAGLDILPFADCQGVQHKPSGPDLALEFEHFEPDVQSGGDALEAALAVLRTGVLRKRADSRFMDAVTDDSNRQQFKSRQPAGGLAAQLAASLSGTEQQDEPDPGKVSSPERTASQLLDQLARLSQPLSDKTPQQAAEPADPATQDPTAAQIRDLDQTLKVAQQAQQMQQAQQAQQPQQAGQQQQPGQQASLQGQALEALGRPQPLPEPEAQALQVLADQHEPAVAEPENQALQVLAEQQVPHAPEGTTTGAQQPAHVPQQTVQPKEAAATVAKAAAAADAGAVLGALPVQPAGQPLQQSDQAQQGQQAQRAQQPLQPQLQELQRQQSMLAGNRPGAVEPEQTVQPQQQQQTAAVEPTLVPQPRTGVAV